MRVYILKETSDEPVHGLKALDGWDQQAAFRADVVVIATVRGTIRVIKDLTRTLPPNMEPTEFAFALADLIGASRPVSRERDREYGGRYV